jgi:prepilin-type processing-associated H-X9-DG protein
MYAQDYDEKFPGAAAAAAGAGFVASGDIYGVWIFKAAGANAYDVTRGAIFPYIKNAQIFLCPSDNSPLLCDYEMNAALAFLAHAQVDDVSGTVLLSESLCDDGIGFWGDFFSSATRHNDGTNICFADGHSKWFQWMRMTPQMWTPAMD